VGENEDTTMCVTCANAHIQSKYRKQTAEILRLAIAKLSMLEIKDRLRPHWFGGWVGGNEVGARGLDYIDAAEKKLQEAVDALNTALALNKPPGPTRDNRRAL